MSRSSCARSPSVGLAFVTDFSSFSPDAVAAYYPGLGETRRFFAALADSLRKGLESRKVGEVERTLDGIGLHVNKAAVIELERQVADILRCLRVQRFVHRLDQAAILIHRFGLHLIAHH